MKHDVVNECEYATESAYAQTHNIKIKVQVQSRNKHACSYYKPK